MWTSTLLLEGKELCFILNESLRDDSMVAVEPAAVLARAINQLCVSSDANPIVVHAPRNVGYRGGGFDDACKSFFEVGKVFRQPAYISTSFKRSITTRFLERSTMPSRVLWRIHIDRKFKCHHVNLVRKSNVPGEEEYLFAPCEPHQLIFV
jgi:hypothetical protein